MTASPPHAPTFARGAASSAATRAPHRPAGLVAAWLVAAAAFLACGAPERTGPIATDGTSPLPTASGQPSPSAGPGEPSAMASAAPAATRLAVLAGNPRDARLFLVDDGDQPIPVALPVADMAWISSDLAGRLLATAADGRLFLAGPRVAAAEPGWREIVPVYPGQEPADPLSFGSLSPDGATVAALAADFSGGRAFQFVLVDVTTGAATVFEVNAWPDGAAPAWLPDGRLLLVARDPSRDRTGLVEVDPSQPDPAVRVEREAYGVALSADGRIAAIDRADGKIAAGARRVLLDEGGGTSGTNPLLPEDPAGLLIVTPPGVTTGVFALDPSGSRLAVTWLDDAGGPATIVRYRFGRDGPVASAPLIAPGEEPTVVVAWLP